MQSTHRGWGTNFADTAMRRIIAAMRRAAVVLALATASIVVRPVLAASPGWSSRPRWQLPERRDRGCTHGWDLGDRPVARRARVRCAEPPRADQRQRRERPRLARIPPWAFLSRPAAPVPRFVPQPAREPLPDPYPDLPPPPDLEPIAWPDATAIAALDEPSCHAYLRRHTVRFRAMSRREAPEVAQPIRIEGPLMGVHFTIPWSSEPQRDHHAIWDCRLAAAMVPLAQWLARHEVREVHYFSVLRRGAMARKRPRSQHNVGLAIDILAVHRIGAAAPANVEDHYPAGLLRACPPGAAPDVVTELWMGLVCHAVRGRLMHTILTPDHDRAHRNHLHVDLQLGQTAPADPFVSLATAQP
jgi:hypothetical protein